MSKSQNDSSRVIAEIQAELRDSIGEASFNSFFNVSMTWEIVEKNNIPTLLLSEENPLVGGTIRTIYLDNIISISKKINTEMQVELQIVPSKKSSQKDKAKTTKKSTPRRKTLTPNSSLPGMEKVKLSCQIPKDQTFDTFVVGKKQNNSAFSICQEIGEQQASGSILLHGPPGSGKSHLLHAIANKLTKEGKKIIYTTAIDYKDSFVLASGPKTSFGAIETFNKRFFECDLLLLDDIEALTGKPQTKVSLTRIVEKLRKYAIVVTASALNPQALRKRIGHGDKCDEGNQLVTALSGMAFALQPPSKTTLIERKAKDFQLALDHTILEYLATTVDGNSHITTSILRTLAKRQTLGENITLTVTKQLVAEYLGEESSKLNLTLDIIEDVVCKSYNVNLSDLQSRSRKQIYGIPRNVAVYLMRELTPHSLDEIGERFKRSHSTALHSHKKISGACIRDKSLKAQLELLRKKFEAYRIEA